MLPPTPPPSPPPTPPNALTGGRALRQLPSADARPRREQRRVAADAGGQGSQHGPRRVVLYASAYGNIAALAQVWVGWGGL